MNEIEQKKKEVIGRWKNGRLYSERLFGAALDEIASTARAAAFEEAVEIVQALVKEVNKYQKGPFARAFATQMLELAVFKIRTATTAQEKQTELPNNVQGI